MMLRRRAVEGDAIMARMVLLVISIANVLKDAR